MAPLVPQLCADLAMTMEKVSNAPSRLLAALRRSSLFHSLSDEELAALDVQTLPVALMSGEVLFRQGDPGDSLYIVISGRLVVSHRSDDHTERIVAELGHGEIVGEMGLVCNEPRSATVVASRDTHLARLTAAGLDCLSAKYAPPIYSAIVRQLAVRLRNETAGTHTRRPARICVAIAGLSRDVPVAAFTECLTDELSRTQTALRLNSGLVDGLFGIAGAAQSRPEDSSHARLADWLSGHETLYRKLVYEADAFDSNWTARCLRQADVILLVARSRDAPAQGRARADELARFGVSEKPTVLVLLQDGESSPPRGSREWTRSVNVPRHFHVRMDTRRDFARLARFLNDRSVGLTLGGGFARGIGHIGVIRAIRELDIPIDFVGGTSMGAIIAGQCAFEWDWREMLEITCRRSPEAFKRDYTLPVVSFLSGRKFSRVITSIAGDLDIEDAWLPFFCVSASLTRAEMKVHSSGNAARSVIASSRAPGLFPPVSWDDELLVDGGIVNMVPSDVMRDFVGQGTVMSVDVSPAVEYGKPDFGLSFSGWQALRRRFRPFSGSERIPGMMELMMRAMEFGRAPSARLKHRADAYLTLPLGGFRYRDFHRGAEMADISYRFAMSYFEKWLETFGRPWTQ
jgi:predicted acylesterase/phospholipase RssA/CRP-like cAMP-binding protein